MISWEGFKARVGAICHKIAHPSHVVRWRVNAEEGYCKGDIACETCKILFWCRLYDDHDLTKEQCI